LKNRFLHLIFKNTFEECGPLYVKIITGQRSKGSSSGREWNFNRSANHVIGADCKETTMNKMILATASFLTITCATGASAADLPRKSVAPIFAQVPAFSWTGFYVGLNAGYAWGKSDTAVGLGGNWALETLTARNNITALGSRSSSPNGFTGGIQAGYNVQLNSIVLGLEADANYLGLKKRSISSAAPGVVDGGYPGYTFNQSVEANWLVTLRPRIGVAFDRFLVYATGGLAIANVEGSTAFASSGGYSKAGSKSDTKYGYTVGGGVEYAMTNNWSLKAEYLYTDLGKINYITGFVLPAFLGYSETVSHNMKFHTVRAGVNYKF
jgi:outer membrane immunogenic protein